MNQTALRKLAIDAVHRACQVSKSVAGNLVKNHSIEKEDRSPVTVADFCAQALVTIELRRRGHLAPIIGEESSKLLKENSTLLNLVVRHCREVIHDLDQEQILDAIDQGCHQGGPKGQFWALDPIDGTKGFLRNDQFAIALALVENGTVTLGVLGCPHLPQRLDDPAKPRGCLFVAARGHGAFMVHPEDFSEQRIHVTQTSRLDQTRYCESFESAHSSHMESAQVAKRLGITALPIRMDSQCKYGIVARGDATFYLRLSHKTYKEKIWDHAAGAILVEEAGGTVTDLEGRKLDFSTGRRLENNRGIVATHGRMHAEVLAAVAEVLREDPSNARP